MNLTLTSTIVDNIVIIDDTTTYDTVVRENFAGYLFLSNKKTTGDVIIPVPINDRTTDLQWALSNLADGHYTADLLLIPLFSYIAGNTVIGDTLSKGAVVYDDGDGNVYKSLSVVPKIDGDFIFPHLHPAYWIKVNLTDLYSAYDPTFIPQPGSIEHKHLGSIDFVYYNNLINAYTKLAKEFANTSKCDGDYLERLRKLRDKYEAVELATAASNYLGAQLIIEASDNLLCNSQSC